MDQREARPAKKNAKAPVMTMSGETVDESEIGKFAALADKWWDPDGAFRPLHRMNPIRLDYLRAHICAQFGRDANALKPLKGLRILDVGCGGGLLCEPLARMGAGVMGIDAAEEGINAARAHADAMGLEIDYRAIAAEDLQEPPFDAVVAMEIVEHVTDIGSFARALAALVKPDGLVALSTLNRTPQSYALAIVGAEYILRWLPRGTHDWRKFPTPDELRAQLAQGGLKTVEQSGFSYNPITDGWTRTEDLSINYAVIAVPENATTG